MATARDLIERSFTWLGILAAETPLQASEIKDGLEALNDLLSQWDATNKLPGATPVINASDIVNVPRYAEKAVHTQLALDLSPEYGKNVAPGLAQAALDSFDNMTLASINLQDVEFPSTLPTGSGNRDWNTLIESEFFAENSRKNF